MNEVLNGYVSSFFENVAKRRTISKESDLEQDLFEYLFKKFGRRVYSESTHKAFYDLLKKIYKETPDDLHGDFKFLGLDYRFHKYVQSKYWDNLDLKSEYLSQLKDLFVPDIIVFPCGDNNGAILELKKLNYTEFEREEIIFETWDPSPYNNKEIYSINSDGVNKEYLTYHYTGQLLLDMVRLIKFKNSEESDILENAYLAIVFAVFNDKEDMQPLGNITKKVNKRIDELLEKFNKKKDKAVYSVYDGRINSFSLGNCKITKGTLNMNYKTHQINPNDFVLCSLQITHEDPK